MSFITALVGTIKSLWGIVLLSPHNTSHIEQGLKECSRAIRTIHKHLKEAKTIGEKLHLQAALANVKSFRRQFQNQKKHGGGLSGDSRKSKPSDRVSWDDATSAFDNRLRTSVITNLKHKDASSFLEDSKSLFTRRIKNALKTDEAVKVNTVFGGEFKIMKAEEVKTDNKYFTTSNVPIYRNTDLHAWFDLNVAGRILKQLEEFQERDSGWTLTKIVNLGVNINKFTPQLGSSYIDLPASIKRRKACVNVKNSDDACFAWAVTSALYPADQHVYRTSSYPHYSKVLKLTGIQFPMTIRQVPRFEKQNSISVNVYILEKSGSFNVLPTYLTKEKREKHANLLLVQDDEVDGPVRYHYVWIKDLSRLVSSQLSTHHGKKFFCDGCSRYFYSSEKLENHKICCMMMPNKANEPVCDRCLNFFPTQQALDDHSVECRMINNCAIRMPKEHEKILKFKNFKNKERVPFIIYVDLESVLIPCKEKNKYQEHVPAAIGYYVKCAYDDSLSFYRSYRGEDCMTWFAAELNQFAEDVETVFLCPHDMVLTSQQQEAFNKATHCHICEKPFSDDDHKVRDHNHLIPENNYRGPAHNSCNINYKDGVILPLVIHNLSGYDANFLIAHIANEIKGRIDLLPVTKEKYISFTKHIEQNLVKFRFIDSFRFMASSLDSLASYLTDYPNLRNEFSDLTEDKINLLSKKGVYPYDFMEDFDKFNYNQLPTQPKFYNKLNDSNITNDEYAHAQHVWDAFKIQNLGEYTDLYMKTDIMLLADVFEQFRSSCLKTYNLDPAHYYTLPGYTWDCMLFKTGQSLELLTDVDMLMFIEKGIRGGLSQCSKRRGTANNKYMQNGYNPLQPPSYLMYYDINNQYGWAMSQYLPYGGFEWCNTNIDVTSIPDDSPVGYILEVDLEYPTSLHDRHKNLPFCPEHSAPPGFKDKKLLATLHNKHKYVIHYQNLKQALAHGLMLKKIHRVLKFDQSAWLKPYIDLNTSLRKAAKNEFEKNLFKLMNNAVFGKTMENIRKHSNVKLVTQWDGRYGAEALISKPEFKSLCIFGENFVAIELNKTEIFFNKPIYVGMSILDLAKTTIYNFHYEYMDPTFDDNCMVLYTDTDSLIYEIKNQDVYEIMRRDCQSRFDTSDYPIDNMYGIPSVNKKVLGLMKDENNGHIMTDFIGLRAKMYSIKLDNNSITKKIKGVKKSVVKNEITFDDYVECLENFTSKNINQNLIRAEKHKVFTITQTKLALSPHDNKRYLIPDSYNTLPWGHYSIMDVE